MFQLIQIAWKIKVSDFLPLSIQNLLRTEFLDVTVAHCPFKQALIFLGKALPFKGKKYKYSS